jgi:hypothetical protein
LTTYRVGAGGASVLDPEGKFVFRIRPGYVVVEGTIETARLAAQDDPKRLRGYADKRQRVVEDKGCE